MRVSEALTIVHDEHRRISRDRLVIKFSHAWALHKFMRAIEADIGMRAGELASDGCEMYDGIEFRVIGREKENGDV